MAKYAAGTEVPVKQSRMEIEHLLELYQVADHAFGTVGGNPMLQFDWRGRRIRMRLLLPDPNTPQFTQTPNGRYLRTKAEAKRAYDQEVMRLWRGFVLTLKAKLVAVTTGIESVDEAFLAHEVLESGVDVLEETYRRGIIRELPSPHDGRTRTG